MKKEIIRRETYRSSSNASKLYETLLYDDGTTSCNCPGWTRRVAPDGSRTCKHIIISGFAPVKVENFGEKKIETKKQKQNSAAFRKFALDD